VYLESKPSQKHVFCESASEQYIATQKLTLRPSITRFLENNAQQGIATHLPDATADANGDSRHGFDWLINCHVNFQ
jgi:hypothetical protein